MLIWLYPKVKKFRAIDIHKDMEFFSSFHDMKHNVILNWVDAVDERGKHGLAVFCDHTTSYAHAPDHPLSLVLGWGGRGWWWWHDCPLHGLHEMRYAVAPHEGRWDAAGICLESARWNEPLLTQIMPGAPAEAAPDDVRSLLSVSDKAIEVPTLLIQGRDLLARLFNASGDASRCGVSVAAKPSRVELVELDGRVIEALTTRPGKAGRYEVRVNLPRFGLRTVRFRNVLGARAR